MTKMFRSFLLLLSFMAILTGAATAGAGGSVREFDLAKTGTFMKEMETRPDFPVSTVLANDYVFSLFALGDRIEPARKKAIISHLKEAQKGNGGFVADRADKNASLLYTDIALDTLALLKESGAIDVGRVRTFVASLKNADGGFGFSQESRESSLATTYYAVRILRRIGGLDLVDKGRTARYIKEFERKDGGFGYVRGPGVADPKNSYMAVFILKSLGMLDDATGKNTIKYLEKSGRTLAELDGQLYTILALKELGAADKINRKFAIAFLKEVYVPLNGGFGPIVGYGSTPDSTTTAIRILAGVGRLKPVMMTAQR